MEIKTLQVGPIGTNCYLLCDEVEKKCAVIDPGGDATRILHEILRTDCEPCAVFLTHGHYDHTGAAEEIARCYPGLPVYLNRRDAVEGPAYVRQIFPQVSGAVDYDEGDIVEVGILKVSVMATPGHTLGGVTLRCGDVLFCGDTLFAGSCGRTDLPGGSMKSIMASLKRLGELEGNLKVYPGHMEPSTLDVERKQNYYLMQALRG